MRGMPTYFARRSTVAGAGARGATLNGSDQRCWSSSRAKGWLWPGSLTL